ncbi:MAG TPA: recombination protein O N-terminal domain-containing protein, partial [Candidatus Cloacimonadota bacterium]|nr:recombination protein O N-terminal domain-containing protein [Candidatus Cloacimonadota bacterium]
MKAKITDRAIIVKVTNFSETSLIVRCITANHGFISFLAKGLRKTQDKTQLISLLEYELNLYSPREQGLYLFADANLISENTIYTHPETWAAAECGIELLEHLLIPPEEYGCYYDLVK